MQDFFHRQYESKGNKSVLKSKQYPVPTGMPADTLPGAVMRSIIKGSNVFCHGYEDQRCVSSFVLSLRIYDRMARLVAGGVISGWKVEFFRVGSWEPIVVACFNPKP